MPAPTEEPSTDSVNNPLDSPNGGTTETLGELSSAAAVEAEVSEENAFGRPGSPIDRHSPFVIGLSASLGVATTALLLWAVYAAHHVLILFGLSLFIAAGLDPVVMWLQRRSVPRWAAVLIVVVGALALFAGVLALIVPVVTTQISNFINHLPTYEKNLTDRSTFLGKMNNRYHLSKDLQTYLTGHGSVLASGVVGVGRAVISGVVSTAIVLVVTIYLLADLPRVKHLMYHLAPRSRRARVVLLGDQIFAKVGGYVLGNVTVSVIAGAATWIWAEAFGIPYPVLLAVVVAIFDLIPLIGSTIGGVIVALVALTVSLPVAGATIAFYVLFRFLEDYLITPRVMGATVEVPGLVTVIATLIGGTLLGIIGALVAVPIAAGLNLILKEVSLPRLDQE